MVKRIIEISNGPTYLSIKNQQLLVKQGEHVRSIPCEDIGAVIVDHPAVTMTHPTLLRLLDSQAAVVFCGEKHMPSGMVLPLESHSIQSERYRAQLNATEPFKKQMWKQIIINKIKNQALILEHCIGNDGDLRRLSRDVRSGDTSNVEAAAARRYWSLLMPSGFKRDRLGAPPNNYLNYGYMILRSAMARSLAVAGLLPTFGIHHHNRYNAFCLADDVMEPYRPYIDLKVYQLMNKEKPGMDLTQSVKRVLLALFYSVVKLEERDTTLFLALQATGSSLAQSFQTGEVQLSYPSSIPKDHPHV
jgi:CRISP-associated protein Cas1